MPFLRVVVPISFACFCAAGAACAAEAAAQPAPWGSATDESGRPADPNAGSRGAPAPASSAQGTHAQPSSVERSRAPATRTAKTSRPVPEPRSAAAGASTSERPAVASSDETPRPSTAQTSTTSDEQIGWRSRDWGWLGLLGLFGLLGLLRRGRYQREMYPYAPPPSDEPPDRVRVYETPGPAVRP